MEPLYFIIPIAVTLTLVYIFWRHYPVNTFVLRGKTPKVTGRIVLTDGHFRSINRGGMAKGAQAIIGGEYGMGASVHMTDGTNYTEREYAPTPHKIAGMVLIKGGVEIDFEQVGMRPTNVTVLLYGGDEMQVATGYYEDGE